MGCARLLIVEDDDRVRAALRLALDDDGPGVPEADRAIIFERFTTGGSGRDATAGTGLGLALVAETVTGHGGHVRCVGRPGGGARMVVVLPVEHRR